MRWFVLCLGMACTLISGSAPTTTQPCVQWAALPYTPATPNMATSVDAHKLVLNIFNQPVLVAPEIGSDHWLALINNVMVLIDSLVDKELSAKLHSQIDQQKILVDIMDHEGNIAAVFAVDPTGRPWMLFSALYLSRITSKDQIADNQTTIVHEYEHYLQWQRATGRERALFGLVQVETSDDCVMLWRHELEAFQAGCRHRLQVPLSLSNDDICGMLENSAAFQQEVFRRELEAAPQCMQVMAKLAGHPDGDRCVP